MQKIINEDIHAATEIFFSVNESVDLTEAAKAKKKRKLKKVKKPSKDQVLKDKTEIWEGVTGARGYATIPSAVSGGEFQFQLPNKAWPAGRVDFWMKQSDGYTADEIKSSKADINKQIKSLRDKVTYIYKVYNSKFNKHPYTGKVLNDLNEVINMTLRSIRKGSNITAIDQYASLGGGRQLASKDDYLNSLEQKWNELKDLG